MDAVGIGLAMIRGRVGADRIAVKGPRDLVTDTDVAVEDAIRAELGRRYPAYPVVGEERGGAASIGRGPFWLVDPICGTHNFASGLPLHCANVALVEDGSLAVGVVGDGGTGDRYVAERGMGAWLLKDGAARALRASEMSRSLSVSDPGSVAEDQRIAVNVIRAAILGDRWFVRMLGTTLGLAHLAAGYLSAYLQVRVSSPVHTAAGCLLASEAGATITDLDGRPVGLRTGSFLASATPELHDELLAMVAEARNEAPAHRPDERVTG
jgi:myo-inositol-1(or 4)-monophosphatase